MSSLGQRFISVFFFTWHFQQSRVGAAKNVEEYQSLESLTYVVLYTTTIDW